MTHSNNNTNKNNMKVALERLNNLIDIIFGI